MMMFLRHCIYALAAFSVAACAAEFFVPGAVSPFLDPVPFVIGSFILLAADAMFRRNP
jgi:hypothetical protein